jgi:RNA polymerase sigma-70 factor (ECF subfamily)
LEELFAADVVSYSDGGGVVRATRIPVRGARTVAKYYRAFAPRFWTGVEVAPAMINGGPAMLLRQGGITFAVVTLTASAAGIDQLLWMMNPGKLAAAG